MYTMHFNLKYYVVHLELRATATQQCTQQQLDDR